MGILNLTPDSFSDGGRHDDPASGLRAAVQMVEDGAALLDVGAMSTRPGSTGVTPDEEWARLEPVLADLRAEVGVPISLDTTRASVLQRALEVGVDVLNDVSAMSEDPAMVAVAADAGLPVVLMHRRGTPRDMQADPRYDDAVQEVSDELGQAVARALDGGVEESAILLDPGIGFGKRLEDNVALLAGLPRLVALGRRTVLGCSRKAMLGTLTGQGVESREHATTATTVLAALAGVDFVRVHDCRAAADALAVVDAVSVASIEGRR
jgi:dihydropteroate synthase